MEWISFVLLFAAVPLVAAAFVAVIDSYRVAVCRIRRDCLADLESFGTKG